MTLREVYHVHIPVLTESSTLRDAIDKMDIYQFPALVIVNEVNSPIAVITEGDVCRAVQLKDSMLSIADDPALIYASKDPVCVSPDTEISDAFHRMLMSGLTLLPVVDSDILSGVVLRVDLMQAMIMDANQSDETE